MRNSILKLSCVSECEHTNSFRSYIIWFFSIHKCNFIRINLNEKDRNTGPSECVNFVTSGYFQI